MNSGLTLVTGADSSFFRKLCQLLLSIERQVPQHAVYVFDLGLTREQVLALYRRHPGIQIRKFPFEKYPDFVSQHRHLDPTGRRPPILGCYAWKPILLCDLMEELGGRVFWLDSATILHGSLAPVERQLEETGVWVPISGSSRLKDWTHPGMVEALEVEPDLLERRNRHGGLIAFDSRVPMVARLIQDWKRWALEEDCIAPAGSDVSNHRYDQSLLTILLNRAQDREGLVLTRDENNISSTNPVMFLSVGNKVHEKIPLVFDPVVRAYFCMYRFVDRIWHLLRRRFYGKEQA